MKKLFGFIKTTAIGGIVFLVPVILFIIIFIKAFEILAILAKPFADVIPIDTVAGFAVANVITIISIVLLCFFAGLLARTEISAKFLNWLESTILNKVPIYAFIKGLTENVAGIQSNKGLKAVLLKFDDKSQIGLEVERINDTLVAVFLPGSPNPWAGVSLVMHTDRVEPLDISIATALQQATDFGQGARRILAGETSRIDSTDKSAKGSN